MKKAITVVVAIVIFVGISYINGYASDYKGDEKQGSIFQKVGDFITGKYNVNGEPIKKTGVFQPIADEIKKTEPVPVK